MYQKRAPEVIFWLCGDPQVIFGSMPGDPGSPGTHKIGPKNSKIINFQTREFYVAVNLGMTTGCPETVLALKFNGV